MLIRPLLKLTLLLMLLFAGCIGLIRAQPYDDSELRAFLTPPDGCPMPCFMGIHPGVTTEGEAVAILEAHEWVEHIQVTGTYYQNIRVSRWTGRQPTLIDSNRYTIFRTSRAGKIDEIYVPLTMSAGFVYLLLGEPSTVDFLPTVPLSGSGEAHLILPVYDRSLIRLVSTPIPCPLQLESFWKSAVDISMMSENFRSGLSRVTTWDIQRFYGRNPLC